MAAELAELEVEEIPPEILAEQERRRAKLKLDWPMELPWMRQLRPTKLQAAPKPRIEKPEKAIARIEKEIRTAVAKQPFNNCDRHIGQKLDGGKKTDYYMKASDGHRALLVAQTKKYKPPVVPEQKQWLVSHLPTDESRMARIEDPQFHTALRRMECVNQDDHRVGITFWKDSQEIELTSKSEDMEGTEIIPAKVYKSGYIDVSASYLLSALGVWPVDFHMEGNRTPITIVPVWRPFLFVFMPIVV
jgi:hypothetical protein